MITDDIEKYEKIVKEYKDNRICGNDMDEALRRLSRKIEYLEPAQNQLKNKLRGHFLKKELNDIKNIIITSRSIEVVIDRNYVIQDYELEILQSVDRPFSIWFSTDITVTYVLKTQGEKEMQEKKERD